MCVCVCARVRVHACVHACLRARVSACVCVYCQCIHRPYHCDGMKHCMDGSDEKKCWRLWEENVKPSVTRPPAIVNLTRNGIRTVDSLNNSNATCPDTHFQCPGEGYCLPVYVRCNSVYDCPGREDEKGCDRYTCPGFYRCRNSPVCVHADHVCDDVFQCPEHDDELTCRMTCPDTCQCHGYAFVCTGRFPAENFPELRYLIADRTGMKLQDVSSNRMLIHLSLQNCDITDIRMADFPNLYSLDLGHNSLTHFTGTEIEHLENLHTLSVASNVRLSLNLIDQNVSFSSLTSVDFSDLGIQVISDTFFQSLPNIHHLNLSGNRIHKVFPKGFSELYELKVLDATGSPMTHFPRDVFRDLQNIETITVDNYKLCCPAILPEGFNPENCHAPADEISSCDALLKADVFRVFLAVYAFMALVGNLASFVYRVYSKRGAKKQLGFDVFVTHLCVSDFLMGVYLAIIGVADRWYYGSYEWNDIKWMQSGACHFAGFLSLLSSEVSALQICFITLELFLAIRFPLKDFRFSVKSAQVLSVAGWVVGVVLAAVPLLPFTEHWQFYSQTGICIPLPITRKVFPGSDYTFIVMIVFNFVLFLFIAFGQLLIFWSYYSHSKTVIRHGKKSEDFTIARRLLLVVMSDFLCWFPIGLLGLMARSGIPIYGGVNVAMAVFVLPLNSAVNPFLYTLHIVLDRRRQARIDRKTKEGLNRERISVACQTYSDVAHFGQVSEVSSISMGRPETKALKRDSTPAKGKQLLTNLLQDSLVTLHDMKLLLLERGDDPVPTSSTAARAIHVQVDTRGQAEI